MHSKLSHKLDIYFQAKIPVICVTTPIKERIITIQNIYHFTSSNKIHLNLWNPGWQVFKKVDLQNSILNFSQADDISQIQNIFTAFDYLLNYPESSCFIIEDLFYVLKENPPFLFKSRIISQITNIYYQLNQDKDKFLILLVNDSSKMPEFLKDLIPVISTPLPTAEEVATILQDFIEVDTTNFDISSLINAAKGLNSEEIRCACALAYACFKWQQPSFKPSNQNINSIAGYLKEYKIDRFQNMGLNFIKQDSSDFAGFDLLKKFIRNLKSDFSPQAREANIPLPKGCLLVGPPGTGKTLSARVSAKILGFPLVSVDTANVVATGSSYLQKLILRVEACAPCVLYFDEFDKIFDASSYSGEDKSSRSILAVLLTWLQDKTSPVFTIATLNRLEALPPELTRVGRFDEIFWVGFPQAIERKQILTLHLSKFDPRYKHGDPLTQKQWRTILNKTVNCTGAELARCVDKAAKELFYQGREIEIGLEELLAQREQMVSLYSRDTDRILAMENKAKHFSQPASSPDTSEFAPTLQSYWGGKNLDKTASPCHERGQTRL